MNQPTFVERLEALGYFTLPRPHAESPGHSGLLVLLREAARGHEPDGIQLRLHEWDGRTARVHLHADISQPLSHVVCPGQIVIRSRQEQEATFYSFGGTLESEVLSGETVYSLRSAAPILKLLPDRETVANLLADETESSFARAEAQLGLSSQVLLDRVVKAGPEAVYLAVLHSLLRTIENKVPVHHQHSGFVDALIRERSWHQEKGRWPVAAVDLVSLLQTDDERNTAFNA